MPETSKYPTRLKNRYLREFSGKSFRITSPQLDVIGRPDFEHKDSLKDATGLPLLVRLVNPSTPWYEQGNVEIWDAGEKKFQPCPTFHDCDADGRGAYVRPVLDQKTKQIVRFESGKVQTVSKFKWYAVTPIETEEPITVQKFKTADNGATFTTEDVTGTSFELEVSYGGEKSQYGKLLGVIRSYCTPLRAEGINVNESDVLAQVIHHPEEKMDAIYEFKAIGRKKSAPVAEQPSYTAGTESVTAEELSRIPF